eukprot:s1617_g3.t1
MLRHSKSGSHGTLKYPTHPSGHALSLFHGGLRSFAKAEHRMEGYAAGYARRAQLGESKSNDRKKLLTDRNAYIAYLEHHVERFNAAYLEVESLHDEVRLMRGRLDDLEERFDRSHRSSELVKAQTLQQLEVGQSERHEAFEHVHRLESRGLRLEQALSDSRSVAEADMSRLRNELNLSVQELAQRLDERLRATRERMEERLQASQELSKDEAALVIREAQATCVRLADDALGAAETSQKKVDDVARSVASAERRVEDLKQETEASLDAMRAQLVALQAELAGRAAAGPDGPTAELQRLPDGDALDQQLTTRLGHQVLQLSEVVQRVVQSQAALSQQLQGKSSKVRNSSRSVESKSTARARSAEPLRPTTAVTKSSDLRRRMALDELYRELQQLEGSLLYVPDSFDENRLLLPSVLLLTANLLNSMSMLCSGVTLTYVVKSLIPFFTVICCRIRGQHFEAPIYVSLLPVCMGVSIASATDVECSLLGLLCALGSSMAQTLLNISSKDRIQELNLSGMEAFTVMATVCTGLSFPLLAVSYAKDDGSGVVTACLSLSQEDPCPTSMKVVAMAALAYHIEYTLNFLFVALCNPLAFSVTDILRRLGTICCGALLFSKPMTFLNGLGVVISLLGVISYTVVSRRISQRNRDQEWTDQYKALKEEDFDEVLELDDYPTRCPMAWRVPCTQILHAMQAKRQLSFPVPFCTLSWQDLEVAYRTPHGRRITLHRQSGYVEGGCMMAIMGASGAGKSTLLDQF